MRTDIPTVPGQYFGHTNGHLDVILRHVYSVCPDECRDRTSTQITVASFTILTHSPPITWTLHKLFICYTASKSVSASVQSVQLCRSWVQEQVDKLTTSLMKVSTKSVLMNLKFFFKKVHQRLFQYFDLCPQPRFIF
jgi:hypothetical protein